MIEDGVFYSGKLEDFKELENEKNREAQIVLQASCLALYTEPSQFSNLMPDGSDASLLGRDPFPLLHCTWTHLLPLIQG